MTKSTSPAANAGLPAIDRRALVCSLGTASIAGVPALASAAPNSDPVFQAMAALEQLKIHAEELYEAHSVAEDAICDSTIGNVVTLETTQSAGQTHRPGEPTFHRRKRRS